MKNKINWTRIYNDSNGNPRYVCHFLDLVTENEREIAEENKRIKQTSWPDLFFTATNELYNFALNRAKKLGGKKFHNKKFVGGIVFQSYNIEETEKQINKFLEEN